MAIIQPRFRGRKYAMPIKNEIKIIALSLLALCLCSPLFANPILDHVSNGTVNIESSATTLQVNQTSQKAIINWNSFNIQGNEKTHFNQPAGGVTLNRINAANGVSQIFGQLTATGKVILVNPAGIYFGPNAYVNVGGIIASTADISDKNFLTDKYIFDQASSSPGTIVNRGQIIAAEKGLVALLGSNVSNEGMIQANLGHVILASGKTFTIDMRGDGLINFSIDEAANDSGRSPEGKRMRNAVNNSGTIIANGGTVILSANSGRQILNNVINMKGFIEANNVSQRNGTIILSAGTGNVRVSGKMHAAGGTIKILGTRVKVTSTAKIDVSHTNNGGQILIGGNYQGKGEEQNAEKTKIENGAEINADSLLHGNGGQIIIWSNQLTDFHGFASARGGSLGGNGGLIEVSSHRLLKFSGSINLAATHGSTGTLLLDPENITIQNAGPTTATASGSPTNTYTATSDNSILTVSDLINALANANVLILTGDSGSQAGDIAVANNVTWSNGNSLTLSAYGSINFTNNAILTNSGGATINLNADNTGTGIGTVSFVPGTGINLTSGGAVNIYYNPVNFTSPTNYAPFVNGAIPTAYMLITNGTQLQNISTNLSGNYALAKPITLSGNVTPIGNSATPFIGKFDGRNNAINNLTIVDATANGDIGLFGYTSNAIISNLQLNNVTITESANAASVGSLIGRATNTIVSNVLVSAVIQNTSNNLGHNMDVGGIIGSATNSQISNAQSVDSSITVNSTNNGTLGGNGRVSVGGLIGYISGTSVSSSKVINGFIHSNINAISNTNQSARNNVGGLIGGASNTSAINNSTSSTDITHNGNVTAYAATAQANIGGLVGRLDTSSTISNSSVAGNLEVTSILTVPTTGSGYVFTGGLIGNLSVGNTSGVTNSFSTGSIVLHATVNNSNSPPAAYFMTGGLIGQGNGDIDNSYSTSNITADLTACTGVGGNCTGAADNYAFYLGGLAGDSFSYIRNSYSTGTINVTGNNHNGEFGVGGIVGSHITLYDRGIINLSRSGTINVSIINTNGGRAYVGGIAGNIIYYGTPSPSNPAFDNLYSSSVLNVTAVNNASVINIGGLIGSNGFSSSDPGGKIDRSLVTGFVNPQITNTNAGIDYVGGFVGYLDSDSTAQITRSFWDTDMTGYNQNQGIGNISGAYPGLTPGCFGGTCSNGGTANLSNQTTFINAGWDFTSTWNIINNYSYPYLLIFNPAAPQVFSGTINLAGRNTVNLVSNGVIIDSVITTNNGFFYFSESTDAISNALGLIYVENSTLTGNSIFKPSSNESLKDLIINDNQINVLTTQLISLSNDQLSNLISGLGTINDILFSANGLNIIIGNALHSGIDFITSNQTLFQLTGSINSYAASAGTIVFNHDLNVINPATIQSDAVTFNGKITGAGKQLTIQAANVAINDLVDLGDITIQANNITLNTPSISTSFTQIYNGVITLTQNLILEGLNIYLNNGVSGPYELKLQGLNGNNYFKLSGNFNVASLHINAGNTSYVNTLDLSQITSSLIAQLTDTFNGTLSTNQWNLYFTNINQLIGSELYALSNLAILPNKANNVVVNNLNNIIINDPITLTWFNLLKSTSGNDIVTFNTPTTYNTVTHLLSLNGKTVQWEGFNANNFRGDITFLPTILTTNPSSNYDVPSILQTGFLNEIGQPQELDNDGDLITIRLNSCTVHYQPDPSKSSFTIYSDCLTN